MRRRKQVYPPAKTATKGQPAVPGAFDPRNPPGRTVTINLAAGAGRAIRVGDRVRIQSGLFAGEAAVVESEASGVISSVMVRTEAGRTRRARTIDLEPIRPGEGKPPAEQPTETSPDT
ncbi:MAG: hypothetical protein L0221_11185 [Chloroflexi bacterium]|nr:hypothetical protein [Chloroflexota bacterium]